MSQCACQWCGRKFSNDSWEPDYQASYQTWGSYYFCGELCLNQWKAKHGYS